MDSTRKTERIHALDSLRAIMMLLGIVLHSAETYTTWGDNIWPKDPEQSHRVLDYIDSIIHIFRMPIFFMVSGFFGSMLFYERGKKAMLINRAKRILLPFLVFLLMLNPIILSALKFTSQSFGITITGISTIISFIPQSTYHLWFLYYLLLITGIAFAIATILEAWPSLTSRIKGIYEGLMSRSILPIFVWALITFLTMLYMWDYWVDTPLFFSPDVDVILFYSLHYFVGWLLFKSKHLLQTLTRFDWTFTIAAFLMFSFQFIWSSQIDDVLYGVMNALISWLFIFGITGLFIRYGSGHSSRMRYISDASYWVYLVHLPLTLYIPGVITNLAISPIVKFFMVLLTTTAICFIAYHYLVRATFIGKFLNGRTYPTNR